MSLARALMGEPVSEVEALTGGNYNEAYRIDRGTGGSYVLRVAPSERDQFSSERHLMRNEYLGRAFLSEMADLVPPVIAADFSHAVLDHDALIIPWVEGVSGSDYLRSAPEPLASMLWRSMGEILRRFHQIEGTVYGRLTEPWGTTWTGAILTRLDKQIADLQSIDTPHADLLELLRVVSEHRAILDGAPLQAHPRRSHSKQRGRCTADRRGTAHHGSAGHRQAHVGGPVERLVDHQHVAVQKLCRPGLLGRVRPAT